MYHVAGLYAALDTFIHEDMTTVISTEGGTARQLGHSPLYAHCVWMGDWTILLNLGAPDAGGILMVSADDLVRPATDF